MSISHRERRAARLKAMQDKRERSQKIASLVDDVVRLQHAKKLRPLDTAVDDELQRRLAELRTIQSQETRAAPRKNGRNSPNIGSMSMVVVRFNPGDVVRIDEVAAALRLQRSAWIRRVVLNAVTHHTKPISIETHEHTQLVAVRYPDRILRHIHLAARACGLRLSGWIRATVLSAITEQDHDEMF